MASDLNLLRKNGSPEITPWMDAMERYISCGSGIYGGILGGMGITCKSCSSTTAVFSVGTGMGQALGYQFTNPLEKDFTFTYGGSSQSFLASVSAVIGVSLFVGQDEANDTIAWYAETYAGTMPSVSSSEILTEGYSKSGTATKIPLYKIHADIVENHTENIIRTITPGTYDNADNIRADGGIGNIPVKQLFNVFGNLGQVTKDYNGNTVSTGIAQMPGAIRSDSCATSLLTTHLGAYSTGNSIDSNLKVANAGYITLTRKLFTGKAISGTTSFTMDSALPDHLLYISIYGKSGTELMRAKVSNGEEFPIDSYDIINTPYMKGMINGTTFTATVATAGNVDTNANPDEFTSLSCYAVYGKADI